MFYEKDVIVVQGDCKLDGTLIRRYAFTPQIYVWTQHDVDVDGVKKAFGEPMHIFHHQCCCCHLNNYCCHHHQCCDHLCFRTLNNYCCRVVIINVSTTHCHLITSTCAYTHYYGSCWSVNIRSDSNTNRAWRGYKTARRLKVICCWSRAAVMNPDPFIKHNVNFRRGRQCECAASECSVISKYFLNLGYKTIYGRSVSQSILHIHNRDPQPRPTTETLIRKYEEHEANLFKSYLDTTKALVDWVNVTGEHQVCIVWD